MAGPYPDGVSYLVTYMTGAPTVGPADKLPVVDTSKMAATVRLTEKRSGSVQSERPPCGVGSLSVIETAHVWRGDALWPFLYLLHSAFAGKVITYTRAYLADPVPDYGDYFSSKNEFYNYRRDRLLICMISHPSQRRCIRLTAPPSECLPQGYVVPLPFDTASATSLH